MDPAAAVLIAQVEGGRRELYDLATAIGSEGLERSTSAGWSGKELLAHIVFWEEAAVPVIRYMLRGAEIPMPWEFGSGPYAAGEDGWPPADVHNAREAAWARGQHPGDVMLRWNLAHADLLETLATVTEAEAEEHRDYFDAQVAHLREHDPELRELLPPGNA